MGSEPVQAYLYEQRVYASATWGGYAETRHRVSDVVVLEPLPDDPRFSHAGTVWCPRCGTMVAIGRVSPAHLRERLARWLEVWSLPLVLLAASAAGAVWHWWTPGAVGVGPDELRATVLTMTAVVLAGLTVLTLSEALDTSLVCRPDASPLPDGGTCWHLAESPLGHHLEQN